jgi:actin-like ATPase involved in cell morphogenesis
MALRKSPKKQSSRSKKSRPAPTRSRKKNQPAGLDLGTSTVVTARQNGSGVRSYSELNAFIDLPPSKFTEQILEQNEIDFIKEKNHIVVYGNGAAKFANMFNAETRRPMRHGLVNATEPYAQRLLEVIVTSLLGEPKSSGTRICFSVPGAPLGSATSLVYHEALMKQMLEGLGYEAKSINEGLAVVFANQEKDNFSGIGISFGGGLTNVCLAYLSVPVFTFAIPKGGDDIDEAVGMVTGDTATRVRTVKEDGLDLNKKPKNKILGALQIYYEDLINTVVEGIQEALDRTDRMPKLDRALPVVLAGGSSLPKGFRSRFERALEAQKLPLPISEVRAARNPLVATAKGALLAAVYDN